MERYTYLHARTYIWKARNKKESLAHSYAHAMHISTPASMQIRINMTELVTHTHTHMPSDTQETAQKKERKAATLRGAICRTRSWVHSYVCVCVCVEHPWMCIFYHLYIPERDFDLRVARGVNTPVVASSSSSSSSSSLLWSYIHTHAYPGLKTRYPQWERLITG